jgi:hypothetical protein
MRPALEPSWRLNNAGNADSAGNDENGNRYSVISNRLSVIGSGAGDAGNQSLVAATVPLGAWFGTAWRFSPELHG